MARREHPPFRPRRVIVIALGNGYLVYDPFEPIAAGEWNLIVIYNKKFKALLRIAGS